MSQLGAIGGGISFQLLQTLECCLHLLFQPQRYEWVMMERTKEAQKLDDVLAMRTDPGGRHVLEAYQCKHALHPEEQGQALTWDWLLDDSDGRSLLQQWADSIDHLQQTYPDVEAYFVTNRSPVPSIPLQGDLVVFDQIPAPDRVRIGTQLQDEVRARKVFSVLRFRLSQRSLESWLEDLHQIFRQHLFDDAGWASLYEQIDHWLIRNDVPGDGKILVDAVRTAAGWRKLQDLDQNFPLYGDYVAPEAGTSAAEFIRQVEAARTGAWVIAGTPGSGKSTLLSKLVEQMSRAGRKVIRHHYYLQVGQQVGDRFSHLRVMEALMSQIMAAASHALGDLIQRNPHPADFALWLERCGQYFHQHGDALVVVVDGLDHVYREQKSTWELDTLCRELFPPRPGIVLVVGTQRVEPDRLPALLLQHCPPVTWHSVKGLSPAGIRQWLQSQTWPTAPSKELLDQLTRQLSEKTKGHPLILRYTWQYIEAQGLANVARVKLPNVPGANVNEYYQWLWRSLPEYAREILHLLAACDWAWRPADVIACLDPGTFRGAELASGLRQIAHLLDAGDGRLRPFHSSLLFFVADQPDHALYADRLRRQALAWLQSGGGTAHLQWAQVWRLQALLGNPEPLRKGTTVQWAADTLSKCYPVSEVAALMAEAAALAIRAGDLGRWAELSLMQERLDTLSAKQRSQWLALRLTATPDPALVELLIDRRQTLSDDELTTLMDHLQTQDDDRLRLCRAELMSRPRPAEDPTSLHDDGRAWYGELRHLVDERRVAESLAILQNLGSRSPGQRQQALQALVPMLCLEGLAVPPLGEMEPLSQLFLGMQSGAWPPDLDFDLGEIPEEDQGGRWRWFFHCFLLNALAGGQARTDDWLARQHKRDPRPYRALARLAVEVASSIRAGVPVSPADLILAADRCGLGSLAMEPERRIRSVSMVLGYIARDLLQLQQLRGIAPLAGRAEWQAALATGLIQDITWVLHFNRPGLRWLDDEGLAWWLAQGEGQTKGFRWWDAMARLAIQHGRTGAVPLLLKGAAGEYFAFEADDDGRILLSALEGLATLRNGDRGEQVMEWLAKSITAALNLVELRVGRPVAAAVTRAFYRLSPAYAFQLYGWLLQQQASGEALAKVAFTSLLELLDLQQPVPAALAGTATTAAELALLAERGQQGDASAQARWDRAIALFGQPVPSWRAEDEDEQEPDGEGAPDAAQFPPELIREFIYECGDGADDLSSRLTEWLRYWQDQGRGPEAIQELQRVARAKGRKVAQVIYEGQAAVIGARQAYPFLVQMLAEADGRAARTIGQKAGQFVVRSFPERWLSLIQDMLLSGGAPTGGSRRFAGLISYLAATGHEEAAFALCAGICGHLLKGIVPAFKPLPPESAAADDFGLSVLYDRLCARSATVRERACTALAELLASDRRKAVERCLVHHATAETLESRALLPLLVWLRARSLHPEVPVPAEAAQCTRWSYAAELLLAELGLAGGRPSVPAHSGDAPADFVPAAAFATYQCQFLPDGEWREEPARAAMDQAIKRQWAYEWDQLHGREHVSPNEWGLDLVAEPADLGETGMSTEIYTSAYLRALAWAVDAGRLDLDEARRKAARCLPVDLALWRVRPRGESPDWWPRLPDPVDDLDAVRDWVERALAGQGAEDDWVVIYAFGTLSKPGSDFALCLDAEFVPEQPEGRDRWIARPPQLWAAGRLQYIQDRCVTSVDAPVEIAAAARVELPAYPRWQWWRSYAGLWAPALPLSPGGLDLVPGDDGVEFRGAGGELVGVWSDWVEGVRDGAGHHLPPAGGQLKVPASLLRQVEVTTQTRLTWRAWVSGYTWEPGVTGKVFATVPISLEAR